MDSSPTFHYRQIVPSPNKEWEIFHDYDPRDHLTVFAYNEAGEIMFPSNIIHGPGVVIIQFVTPVQGECHIQCLPWEVSALWEAVEDIIYQRSIKSS